jgi:Immunity protein Imm1
MERCVVMDWYDTSGPTDEKPTFPVGSAEDMRRCLARFRAMEPRFLGVRTDSGTLLSLGIGGEFGFVCIDTLRGHRQGVYALADPIQAPGEVVFVGDYQPSQMRTDILLPFEDIERIVLEIQSTGEMPTWITWTADG